MEKEHQVETVIEALDLSKQFSGGKMAADGVNLTVPRGAVYGLIGRNGAGKTTTLRMLLGLLRPDRGTAHVLGHSLWNAPRQVRARVGYVSQDQKLPQWMTAGELCHYASHFYDQWDNAYARELADRLEISWEQQVGLMSGGEQRKLAIMLGCAACPEVLILDEPGAGLDPIARRQLIDEIVGLIFQGGHGHTVLFSTHIISDLERVADYIGIMDRGRIIVEEPLEQLQESIKRVQVVFGTDSPPHGFAIPGAVRSETFGPIVTALVRLSDPNQLDALQHMRGVRVNVFPVGLEDAVIQLLGQTTPNEAAANEMKSEMLNEVAS